MHLERTVEKMLRVIDEGDRLLWKSIVVNLVTTATISLLYLKVNNYVNRCVKSYQQLTQTLDRGTV